jgi:modulator of FtsH protease
MPNQQTMIADLPLGDISVNKCLRNTYFLLSLSLLVTACSAMFAMANNAQPIGMILMLAGFIGLPILIQSLASSGWGLAAMFGFSAFAGYTIGPIMSMMLNTYVNGSEIIFAALGSTGLIFLALSAYVLSSKKDFSFMGGMLFVGVMVAFFAGIGAMLFNMPMLNLLVSAAFALLSAGMILYHTSLIIHGGERNYIVATLGIYIALFNLFMSLLRIFAFLAGNRD